MASAERALSYRTGPLDLPCSPALVGLALSVTLQPGSRSRSALRHTIGSARNCSRFVRSHVWLDCDLAIGEWPPRLPHGSRGTPVASSTRTLEARSCSW